MRLWTLHPCYLDPQGLVAAWRETLLAQKVLAGQTKGYRHHPQLLRFREHPRPQAAMSCYLTALADEADARSYRFDRSKILPSPDSVRMEETEGQLLYEWEHLRNKLKTRSPLFWEKTTSTAIPEAHPIFHIVPGEIQEWEIR